ncbi:hypothetical protein PVAP13_2KG278300 [Panicum virgatum]|uniref:Uncharacterized protein n=1 Tax=Panicum virgatum TaxID=38727 RepID=A0A8T0W4Q5_PANVG|nr:hypothetical protein PVAP13_2KG278300 [Panicum virgatum]
MPPDSPSPSRPSPIPSPAGCRLPGGATQGPARPCRMAPQLLAPHATTVPAHLAGVHTCFALAATVPTPQADAAGAHRPRAPHQPSSSPVSTFSALAATMPVTQANAAGAAAAPSPPHRPSSSSTRCSRSGNWDNPMPEPKFSGTRIFGGAACSQRDPAAGGSSRPQQHGAPSLHLPESLSVSYDGVRPAGRQGDVPQARKQSQHNMANVDSSGTPTTVDSIPSSTPSVQDAETVAKTRRKTDPAWGYCTQDSWVIYELIFLMINYALFSM